MIAFWVSIAALLVAAAGCGYLIVAAILVRRFARHRPGPAPASLPAVTVLKPLDGDEPGLAANLASFCGQDYGGPVQFVFGVQDPGDPAIAAVKHLRRIEAARDIDLVIDTKLHGLNRKVSNLINMEQRIRHDVVVLADSDMRVEPDYLARVVAALQAPGIGAVTLLYYGVPATGIWSQFAALAINSHFLPGVVVNLALDWARPCFGSTIALRRDTLAAIGGFEAVAYTLADDYALGQALRAQGHTISVPSFAVAHMCTSKSAYELWRHELRWSRTIRSIDPGGFAGSIVTHPVPWAVIGTLLGAASTTLAPALVILMVSIACRIALLKHVERAFGVHPQPYWLVPARDLLSFAVFLLSFLGRNVSWRGRRYRAAASGSRAGGSRLA
jgi:ceramide glucosyltransferase